MNGQRYIGLMKIENRVSQKYIQKQNSRSKVVYNYENFLT